MRRSRRAELAEASTPIGQRPCQLVIVTRRASGATCGSWVPTPPKPTTLRRKRSWPSPAADLSNATTGRRPATCAWLPATSCWHCAASRTARFRTVELEAADSVWAAAAGPDGSLTTTSTHSASASTSLEGRARQAIDLHYHEHASREAIATQLEMQPDGVKTLLRRTRQVLRECIERKLKTRTTS